MKQSKALATITILLSLALWTDAFAQSLITIRRSHPGGGGGGGGSTELAADAFATNGSLDSYANWVVGFDCEDPQIAGGVVQPQTVGGFACALYSGVVWPANQYGQIAILTLNTASNRDGYISVRHQTGSAQYYACGIYGPLGSGATYEIARKTNAGGYVVLGTGTLTWNSGDVLRCEAEGTTLRLKRNGTIVDTATDSTAVLATGSVGIFIHSGAGATSDAQLDNWSGGSIP